ncbi:TPA: hypothetical protein U2I51_004262, partial [Providencia rettgeri]|nr:hypothetical protein [Providencia rettgeri]
MYNIGTVTTTANSTKVTGTSTKWKDNNSRVSAEQIILIVNSTTAYINSIQSIQSDTELTLSFPAPVAVKNGAYNILTTMVNSVSDAANKIVAMNAANVQFSDIINRLATETGVIEVVLPDGTKKSMKTFAEMDKQLDGKLDKSGNGEINGNLDVKGLVVSRTGKMSSAFGDTLIQLKTDTGVPLILCSVDNKTFPTHTLQLKSGVLMHHSDYGVGFPADSVDIRTLRYNGFFTSPGFSETSPATVYFGMSSFNAAKTHGMILAARMKTLRLSIIENDVESQYDVYHTGNTTKDSNGNLKAASPIVKLFADDIELNDESEGVEMEHLGVGHYLIKGVVGFNADGAWGINNGFVIPQDHNGKNMVLIDYEVRPDGDIEV